MATERDLEKGEGVDQSEELEDIETEEEPEDDSVSDRESKGALKLLRPDMMPI